MKLYDCFLFNNEFDLLEIRLKYLWDVVDVFVLVEADTTFAGKDKPLHFEENKEKFKWAESKIKHVVNRIDRNEIDYSDDSAEASMKHATFRWDLERRQRNHMEKGVADAEDEDLVMMSDVDEIPRKNILAGIRKNGLPRDDKPMYFDYICHNYFLNCQAVGENRWFRHTAIFRKSILGQPLICNTDGMTLVEDPVTGTGLPEDIPEFMKQDLRAKQKEIIASYPPATMQKIRDARWGGLNDPTFNCYDDGGWHFSYLGNSDFIKNKIASISHTEYDTPEYKNDERIERAMANGDDIFGREGHKFAYVDIDTCEDYDEDLKKILKDYPHLIRHTDSSGPRVCLNMIVKDETAIIERCLRSVAPHIDCYVICDTGSTDDTKEKISKVMNEYGVLGEIHDIEFVNFEYARNKALELVKQSKLDFDYILFDDADMEFQVLDPDWKSKLNENCYTVRQYNSMSYHNVRIIRRNVLSKYVGVTHEYLECEDERKRFDYIQYYDHACGSSRKEKFERDARLLEEGMADKNTKESLKTRYLFYLGQTYFDMGDFLKSIEWYKKRIDAGGWLEEIYYSWYRIGLAYRSLNEEKEMLNAFMQAFNSHPSRVEPIYELSAYYRVKEIYHTGYMFATMACSVGYPERDLLFINKEVYEWRRWDEAAICAYWVGAFRESHTLCEKLLESNLLPEEHRERVEQNKKFAEEKL